jgi:hypothetical protein
MTLKKLCLADEIRPAGKIQGGMENNYGTDGMPSKVTKKTMWEY